MSKSTPGASDAASGGGKLLLLLLAGVVLAWLSLRGNQRVEDDALEHAAVGHRLLEFDLTPLSGGSLWLDREDLDGKVVLMNFWGTWCPPCRREMPHLVEVVKRYEDDPNFLFVSVSCPSSGEDRAELLDTTEAYLAKVGYDFQTYDDASGRTQFGLQMAGVGAGLPTTLVVDGHGVIRGVWAGYQSGDEAQVSELIGQLLAKTDGANEHGGNQQAPAAG